MSLFGNKTQASTQTIASGVTIQTSIYGSVVPVVYGRTRMTGNLIWYGGFQAIPPNSGGSGGGKGGGGGSGGKGDSGSSSTDYKASFAFALAEGPLGGVSNVWSSKSETAFGASNLSFADGDLAQSPWGYLTTNFAGKNLSYAGTGYVCAAAYDLGGSAQLPNLSYEVTGLFPNAIAGLPDADPMHVVTDVLTNPRYGIGFPAARLGDLSVFSNYCRAAGLVVSPLFDTQQDAAAQVNQVVQDCNAEFVWSGASLTVVPYGDSDLSANGATYTAPIAALYSLGDDDFLAAGGGDPVQVMRARPSDRLNSVQIEWLNRGNQYNVEIVEAKDQAAIETYGLRTAQPSQSHWFCDLAAATMSATLQLQRQAVRNQYSFTLGWKYCLLDPMDLIEITDAVLGLDRQLCRIVSIEEDDTGNLKVVAEDFLHGSGSAPLYSYQSGLPFIANYDVDPGSVNVPLIFEPPPSMMAASSITQPRIMIGASGGADWGGCEVWLSLDDATYVRMGRIASPARQGMLTAALPSGSDPDATDTLSVDLAQSDAALLSGTAADLNAFRTLCYVDGELVSYETATLTGTNAYDLTTLRRGVYGTSIGSHASGAQFCRLDDNIASFDLPVSPVSYVGQALYLKFTSFNVYGVAEQSLSDVSAYAYTPGGAGTVVLPPSDVAISVGVTEQPDGTIQPTMTISWAASPDPLFDHYDVRYSVHGLNEWVGGTVAAGIGQFVVRPVPVAIAYDAEVRAVRSTGPFYSAWVQDLDVTTVGKTAAPPPPTSLNVAGGYRQLSVSWAPVTSENDIAFYSVYLNVSNTLSTASLAAQVNANSAVIPGLALNTTYWVWVKATDTSGNVSATALGPGSAATLGVESSDITGQIVAGQIAANAIAASNLVSGLDVVQAVATIADASSATSNVAYAADTAKLYRWNGSAWTAEVNGSDITANTITASQIAAGTITSAQIEAGGILAANIAAGTITAAEIAALTITAAELAAGAITGDKINGNFFQGFDFVASTGSGSGQVLMFGTQYTSGGVTYGPCFAAQDSAGNDRAILGHWAGADGLWIYDASGNVIFEEASLGAGVVQTTDLANNAVTYPYGVTIPSSTGFGTLWSHNADAAGTMVITIQASISGTDSGGTDGNGTLLVARGGTTIYSLGFDVPYQLTQTIGASYAFSVTSGENVKVYFGSAASAGFNGASLSAILAQR